MERLYEEGDGGESYSDAYDRERDELAYEWKILSRLEESWERRARLGMQTRARHTFDRKANRETRIHCVLVRDIVEHFRRTTGWEEH